MWINNEENVSKHKFQVATVLTRGDLFNNQHF